MTPSPTDIERIVREVIARLARTAAPHAPLALSTSVVGSTSSSPGPETAVIIDRVVTTQSLDAALTDRTKQIEVQRGAVVTPSARDLLRDRNLSLVETATSRSHATIWIGIDGHLPQNTLRWIYARGQDVAPSGELQQQLQWLENKLADHQSVALIVSDRSMRAAAVANRRPALRAAAIRTTGDLKEAHRQMQANVLVACAGSSVDQLTAIAESASMLSRVQHDVADPLRSH